MAKLSKIVVGLTVVAFMALALHCTGPAAAADPASFYKGKKIKFVVPYRPGGGYDAYTRLIAPYLEKQTGATVIVRNMTGGQTYVALNHVYSSKPDGLTILIIDAKTAVMNQLIKDPKAKKIDIMKLGWLCRIIDEPQVLCLSTKSGFKTIDDLKNAKRTIKFGGNAKGNNDMLAASVAAEILGLDAKITLGFTGSAHTVLAVMRGELDGCAYSGSSMAVYTQQPELFALVTVSEKRSTIMTDVPTIGELIKLKPRDKKLVELLDMILGVGRSVVVTPDTPKDRVEFLRSALYKILHDEEFLAKAKKMDRPIDYLTGEDVENYVKGVLTMPAEDARLVEDIMLEKYI